MERTTELRARAGGFGLSDEEVKAAAKAVNDHAKSAWEKTAKTWRSNSEGLESMKKTLQSKEEEKIKAKEAAEEAKRKEDEAGDEERKKNLELLEKKRAEKKRQQEEAEKKRLARKKQLEEEKAKRDPWLLFPEVVEAEKHLEDLKDQRRDANAKLEFDLSNSLTKDISAAERSLKSVTKKAKKAYKKGEKPGATSASSTESKGDKTDSKELKTLQAKLQDVKERKDKASQAENFKEAKKLKAEQKDLEEKIAKLELWRGVTKRETPEIIEATAPKKAASDLPHIPKGVSKQKAPRAPRNQTRRWKNPLLLVIEISIINCNTIIWSCKRIIDSWDFYMFSHEMPNLLGIPPRYPSSVGWHREAPGSWARHWVLDDLRQHLRHNANLAGRVPLSYRWLIW